MSEPIAVLLVEDDEQHHRHMKAMLDAIPDVEYQVTWVAAAEQAVAFLEEGDHDVCLLGLDLGSETGLDVLRAIGRTWSVPCILMTDAADLDADRDAAEAGAVDFLVKGELTGQQLERSIRYAVENARTLRAALEREERFRTVQRPFVDALTGVANRALLDQRIESAIARLDRAHGSVAVVVIDVDDFGAVNDAHGRAVGDQLLASVASRLLGCVRGAEAVARIDADRFGVCLHDLDDPRSVLRLAERVIHAMETGFQLDEVTLSAACSIGIAVTSNALADATELLGHAHSAVRAAKLGGKGRYEVFEDSVRGEVVERMHLESDLRAAVSAGEIDVAYQPVVQLGSLAIVGFEALARWRSDSRGEVSPAVFIAAAEESGLIHQLGRAVLGTAVHQVAAWQRQFADGPPVSVAVNLSSRQLADPDLVGFVGDLLADSGLAPGTLTLEVNESVMLGDVERAVTLLSKFRELGVRLALDDFGTGYSSLNYLHLLPVDAVKVDQSFIGRIGGEGEAMVAAVAAIANGLRLELVAEGIESGEQRRFLTNNGFRHGQGYLFSAAVTADEAADLLGREAARSVRGALGGA